jgi:hypothetical protein
MSLAEDEGIPSLEEVFEIAAKDVVKLKEIGRGTRLPHSSFSRTLG